MIAAFERTGDLAGGAIKFTHDELCECISGNRSRCGAYNEIVDVITEYAETTKRTALLIAGRLMSQMLRWLDFSSVVQPHLSREPQIR